MAPFAFHSPVSLPLRRQTHHVHHLHHRPPSPLLHHSLYRRRPRMSGVNGGIDYAIDLTKLPSPLASRISYIQCGPDSPTELISTTQYIASATRAHPETLPVLVDLLGFNNPVAASIAVSTLGAAGPQAIPPLLRGVAAFNYAVNAYALRALALIGDASVADVAAACAVRGPIPNVRRAACRAVAALRYGEAGGEEALETLVKLADAEGDWGVRYAAVVGVERFVSLGVVSGEGIRRAVRVLEAAAEGREGALEGNEGEGVDDPAVRARATVALEVFRGRVAAISKG